MNKEVRARGCLRRIRIVEPNCGERVRGVRGTGETRGGPRRGES